MPQFQPEREQAASTPPERERGRLSTPTAGGWPLLARVFVRRMWWFVTPAFFITVALHHDSPGFSLMEFEVFRMGRRFLTDPDFRAACASERRGPLWPVTIELLRSQIGLRELPLRMVSAFFGFASGVALFLLSKPLLKHHERVVAAAYVITSPLIVEFSRDVRTYTFQLFLMTIVLLLLHRMAYERMRIAPVVVVLLSLAAVLNHSAVVLHLFAAGLAILLAYRGAPHWRHSMVALVVTAALSLGWMLWIAEAYTATDHDMAHFTFTWFVDYVRHYIAASYVVPLVAGLLVLSLLVAFYTRGRIGASAQALVVEIAKTYRRGGGSAGSANDDQRVPLLVMMVLVLVLPPIVASFVGFISEGRASRFEYYVPAILAAAILVADALSRWPLRAAHALAALVAVSHVFELVVMNTVGNASFIERERGQQKLAAPIFDAFPHDAQVVYVMPGYMKYGIEAYMEAGLMQRLPVLPADTRTTAKLPERYGVVEFGSYTRHVSVRAESALERSRLRGGRASCTVVGAIHISTELGGEEGESGDGGAGLGEIRGHYCRAAGSERR